MRLDSRRPHARTGDPGRRAVHGCGASQRHLRSSSSSPLPSANSRPTRIEGLHRFGKDSMTSNRPILVRSIQAFSASSIAPNCLGARRFGKTTGRMPSCFHCGISWAVEKANRSFARTNARAMYCHHDVAVAVPDEEHDVLREHLPEKAGRVPSIKYARPKPASVRTSGSRRLSDPCAYTSPEKSRPNGSAGALKMSTVAYRERSAVVKCGSKFVVTIRTSSSERKRSTMRVCSRRCVDPETFRC